MSTAHNKQIVRRAIAALSRGDMEGFLADAADDVTLSVMGTAFSPIQGKQKVLKALHNTLVARLENGGAIAMTIENLIAEGDYVAEQARGVARTKDGKDYNNTYCRVWCITDGKVRSIQEYLDTELVRACLLEEGHRPLQDLGTMHRG
ncbi:MAG: nuclear transport factor 2 family protein [Candidatus Binatia bacterium]|nr:nuclear transport factor 2 family protein [Candidatus Binatia bacterium]